VDAPRPAARASAGGVVVRGAAVSVVFRIGDEEDAAALTRKYHYSGRPAAAAQVVGTWHLPGGLFGDRGDAVAACVFSIPPTRWSEEVWELSRLVRAEGVSLPPLSGLVAETVRFIARRKMAHLLVSFADNTQGHHGGIYQACSWNYGGCRGARMDGLLINGVFYAGRSCNSKWGTQSPKKMSEILKGQKVEPHFDKGKHLYWRSLSKEGTRRARAIGLESLPYPKPNRTDKAA
jgi:hypothetical protein